MGKKDRPDLIPPDVVKGILKSALSVDTESLPDSIAGISEFYDEALRDPAQRRAAEVLAQPLLKRLQNILYGSPSARVGFDAFGRAVVFAAGGREFDPQRSQFVVEEVEVAGRGGTGNKSRQRRALHENSGLSGRTPVRTSTRNKGVPLSARLTSSHAAQHEFFSTMRQSDACIEERKLVSLAGNPTELNQNGCPIVIIDASVVLAGIVPNGLPECRETVKLGLNGRLQVCMTPTIAREMKEVAERGPIKVNQFTHPVDAPAMERLDRLIRMAVNVSDGGKVSETGIPDDRGDTPYVLAAERVSQRGLMGYLLERDHHLEAVAAEAPSGIRVLHPKEFLRLLRQGNIR